MKRLVHEGFDPETLQRALRANDPLVIVLRAHLYMEQIVNVFLKRSILGASFESATYEEAGLRFFQIVHLAEAAGVLRTDDTKGLLAFNSLRNKLAHGYGTTVTDADQEQLLAKIAPSLRREMFEDGDDPPGTANYALLREIAHGLVLLLTWRMTQYLRKKKRPFGYLTRPKR